MARKKINSATDQRKFTLVYNDFLESNLLNHYEKMVFIALKKYADNETMKAYPSLNKLHKITGISLSQVRRSIEHMEELGIIGVEHRTSEEKGNQSNLYTLYDYAEIWNVGSSEDVAAVTSEISEMKLVAQLRARGYTVTKEKGLESDTDQSTETSSINQNLSKNNNNTNTMKNQGEVAERYTLDYLKESLCYDDMLLKSPHDKDMIDTFFHYLHDAMNTTKPTIRVNGEDKPRETVVSVLLKLEYFDFLYAVDKYKANTSKVNNQGAYIITLLYNAKSQSNADITNQVQHDMYGQN